METRWHDGRGKGKYTSSLKHVIQIQDIYQVEILLNLGLLNTPTKECRSDILDLQTKS